MSKTRLKIPTFKQNTTFLPVTREQYEALVNELREALDKVSAPHHFDGRYIARVLNRVTHQGEPKHGIVNKSELFEACVNNIARHLTFDIGTEMDAEDKAAKDQTIEATGRDLEALEQETATSLQ